MPTLSIYPRAGVHTHSNRYLYVTNQGNKTFNSLKEFGIDQGLSADSNHTIFSGFFYSNLLGEDNKIMTQHDINQVSHEWHSAQSYEFRWVKPETGVIITVRRLKRFRRNELI